jgi:hypothetical protein
MLLLQLARQTLEGTEDVVEEESCGNRSRSLGRLVVSKLHPHEMKREGERTGSTGDRPGDSAFA